MLGTNVTGGTETSQDLQSRRGKTVSIGFYLLGEFRRSQLQPSQFLHGLENWILSQSSALFPSTRHGFVDEKPTLFCTFHPAAEEVEISLPDPKHITVSASTSSCGPGYHVYLCDLVHRWDDDFLIRWIRFGPNDDTAFCDETGFFFSGNKPDVYCHMESWLRTLTGSFFDGTLDENAQGTALCMPMDVGFKANSSAITQLGPRTKDWLYRMSRGEGDYREFFPWYAEGLGSEYHLGRALAQMWCDVRWRPPINEHESELLKSVLNSLETAYRLNPTLSFPWNEWNELLEILGIKRLDLSFVKENAAGPRQVGYRRGQVRISLPGYWSIETEGSFSEFQSDNDGTLSAIDPPREIWFNAYSFTADEPETKFRDMRDKALNRPHELVYEAANYISVADISSREAEDGKHYILQSSNVGILCRSVCTLLFAEASDREWAIRVWESLRPPVRR